MAASTVNSDRFTVRSTRASLRRTIDAVTRSSGYAGSLGIARLTLPPRTASAAPASATLVPDFKRPTALMKFWLVVTYSAYVICADIVRGIHNSARPDRPANPG